MSSNRILGIECARLRDVCVRTCMRVCMCVCAVGTKNTIEIAKQSCLSICIENEIRIRIESGNWIGIGNETGSGIESDIGSGPGIKISSLGRLNEMGSV
ncbi:hypothetical protein EVAR_62400_1 [Eumeta japonica]|uniref:Uncharacterized protein n=1 Tax=Eumeta variegata TaxID=151549 RepID=A0A4C1Z7V4_EUMVA|nr:hypothetical protein EVAR_62400_1 [Eumeta japonica]